MRAASTPANFARALPGRRSTPARAVAPSPPWGPTAVRGMASRVAVWCCGMPRVGRPDAAPCAGREPRQAVGAHGDAPRKTLSVCYLPLRPRISRAHYPAARWGHRALPPLRDMAVTPAHYARHAARVLPCGAMGTSRPTAITHADYARPCSPRITRSARHPCGAMVGRRASRLASYRDCTRTLPAVCRGADPFAVAHGKIARALPAVSRCNGIRGFRKTIGEESPWEIWLGVIERNDRICYNPYCSQN